MTFKEYFFKTIATTKSCLKITSAVFILCFVFLFIVLKIGGKIGEEESFIKSHNSISYYIFVYGLTLFTLVLAMISSYNKTKKTIKLFNAIAPHIKESFCLQLYIKQQNPKYHFLEYEIVGLYKGDFMTIEKLQKNINLTLCTMLKLNGNFLIQKKTFDKRYKKKNIELTASGIMMKINIREWNQISVEEVEKYIKELQMVSQNYRTNPIEDL